MAKQHITTTINGEPAEFLTEPRGLSSYATTISFSRCLLLRSTANRGASGPQNRALLRCTCR